MTARPLTAAQQLDILAKIWNKPVGDDVGCVFLPWIPGWAADKAQRRANWNEGRAFKWPEERAAILAHLENHRKDDLYFTPNTFLGEARVIQFTGEEKALYADLDEVDPREIEKWLQPTIAWETSPGRFQGVWLLSQFADGATEAGGLNHRLTAYLKADPSGWDTTQLLRVPGRPNFKFNYKDDDGDSPPGRLLWSNGKVFDVEELDSRLPAVEVYATGADIEDHEIDAVDRHEVWARVRLRVSHTVREYMSMKSRNITDEYDRSEVMWQIERDLADAGCTIAEIVAVIRPTAWNKHEGRNNELQQLKLEAAKAIGVSLADASEDTLETDESKSSVRPTQPRWIADIVTQPLPRPRWIVNNIWAQGSCGFISAEPKSYKSYFALDMALSIATGKPFLNDPRFGVKQGNVLYLQEEDAESLVMYRFDQILEEKAPEAYWKGQITLGGDITSPGDLDAQGLIWTPSIVPVTMSSHVRMGFLVDDPVWQVWLMEFIEEFRFIQVFIDTLGTTLGKTGILDQELYPRVLNPLKEISSRTGAGICIVHHNRKSTVAGGRAGQQMAGLGALHAWVDSALYLSKSDHVTGQPTEIKVERENKLAQDMKFRVRIPTMHTEDGPGDTGERVLWTPEVWDGWAEENDAETRAINEVKTHSRVGGPLLKAIEALGGTATMQQLISHTGKRQGNLQGEINRAQGHRLITGSNEDGWSIV